MRRATVAWVQLAVKEGTLLFEKTQVQHGGNQGGNKGGGKTEGRVKTDVKKTKNAKRVGTCKQETGKLQRGG